MISKRVFKFTRENSFFFSFLTFLRFGNYRTLTDDLGYPRGVTLNS